MEVTSDDFLDDITENPEEILILEIIKEQDRPAQLDTMRASSPLMAQQVANDWADLYNPIPPIMQIVQYKINMQVWRVDY